ncbi:antirepressor AbbA [Fictibacillus sp. WQ 8-8]|uniref:antirepressor AbbA n=1 Tax=unclassified Fictibacillus TaxID=2644029 RepID=UPI0006A7BD94|nr:MULTISPECIES: antirepressor AbbA [unclassified Fictibacillus]MCQ6266671.1 antirepressor AbbA [Fictibacillus sp. WQ 8-8]MED2971397.1 antirepressor AbbA [Fictibacillus sp. B-59209]UZJ80207.1 antirepressor AbbA [Fictibacillus sp. KU28468]SFD55786.1 Antirepressor AbbA [Bacillus sp. OV194]
MNQLCEADKLLLADLALTQKYAKELVQSELMEIELGLREAENDRVKKLNDLLMVLHKTGY